MGLKFEKFDPPVKPVPPTSQQTGPSYQKVLISNMRRRRRRRNFLVDAITQKQINIFFSNLVHMLRVPKGRSLF